MSKKYEYYKDGLTRGLKLSEAIINKEYEAMQYLEKKLDIMGEKQEEVQHAVSDILEYQTTLAAEKYYDICNELSPSDLECEERKVLLNILSSVSMICEHYSDYQKMYITNLRNYIQVRDFAPVIEYNYELIDNIRDLDNQVIILKCLREFLFLENMNFSFAFNEKYEKIFENFSVKTKRIKEIDDMIELTYNIFGVFGIIDMYGSHNMEDINVYEGINEEECDTSRTTDYVTEGTVFRIRNEKINWAADILDIVNCALENSANIIEFSNCILLLNTAESQTSIILSNNDLVVFDKCELVFGNSYIEYQSNEALVCKEGAEVRIENSVLKFPHYFVSIRGNDVSVNISDSELLSCRENVVRESGNFSGVRLNIDESKIEINKVRDFRTVFDVPTFNMKNSKVKEIKRDTINDRGMFSSAKEGVVTNCYFENLSKSIEVRNGQIINCTFFDCKYIISACKEIKKCYFEHCHSIFKENVHCVTECIFNKCFFVYDYYAKDVMISKCYFVNIRGGIARSLEGGMIKDCEFLSVLIGEKDYRNHVNTYGKEPSMIYISRKKVTVQNCLFQDIDVCDGFIFEPSSSENLGILLCISNSKFENCISRRPDGLFIKTVESVYRLNPQYVSTLDRLLNKNAIVVHEKTENSYEIASVENVSMLNCIVSDEQNNDSSFDEKYDEYVEMLLQKGRNGCEFANIS